MLSNKIVVVAGGAGLLGSYFCSAIAEQGGTAIIADIDMAAATAVAERLPRAQLLRYWPHAA